MDRRAAIRMLFLLAAALVIPACKERAVPGPPGPGASAGITYDNSRSGMAATSVQDAIDALDFRVDLLAQVPEDTVPLSNPSALVSYTVPAGKSLVVTYHRANSACVFTAAGIGVGYDMINLGRLVVDEGETVVCPSPTGETPILHKYLVSKDRAPGVGVHVGGAPYTVPAGKTLYITQIFAPGAGGGGDITIDGVMLAPENTITTGENVFVPVRAGRVVYPHNAATFHGYLK